MNTQCIKSSNENRNLTFYFSVTILVNVLIVVEELYYI